MYCRPLLAQPASAQHQPPFKDQASFVKWVQSNHTAPFDREGAQLPKGGDKKRQEVRIEEQPAPLAPNAIPSVPSVEIVPVPVPAPAAPAPAPRVDGDRRDPF